MSNTKCCVTGCENSAGSSVTLHKFPNPQKNTELFNSWLCSVGGDILRLENDHIFKYRRVCHKHFEDEYLCRNNRISNIAVPTLNLRVVSYHRFPNQRINPEQFKLWVDIVGGKLGSAADYETYKKKLVCDIHFTEGDRNRNNRLNCLAVPSLHLCGTQHINEVPSIPLIPKWVKKFEEMGTTLGKPKTGQPRSSRTAENVESASSVPIVITPDYPHKPKAIHPYKIHLIQELKLQDAC